MGCYNCGPDPYFYGNDFYHGRHPDNRFDYSPPGPHGPIGPYPHEFRRGPHMRPEYRRSPHGGVISIGYPPRHY